MEITPKRDRKYFQKWLLFAQCASKLLMINSFSPAKIFSEKWRKSRRGNYKDAALW
jgi:hypothetical protein